MKRKKVLIITYYWPPGSGPGVQRWLKFCKYLPEFNWEPIVITVKNGSYPNTDESLENDIPKSLKVFKTKTLEPFAVYNLLRGKKGKSVEVAMASVQGQPSTFAKFSNYVRSNYFIPDARIGWNKYALKEAKKVIKKEKPDLVITTGPPHSTHLIGLKLRKEFNIKWLADFRDPWTTIYYNQFLLSTEKSTAKDLALENQVLHTADAIITATPGITEGLQSRSKKIHTLPNGFDEDDFSRIKPSTPEKFKMAYVGNLKPVQNTRGVWEAIALLAKENPDFKSKFEFELTGNLSPEFERVFKEFGIESLITIKSFVPHKHAIQRMMDAHVLFLPIPKDKGNKLILTGKIFEYLATKRPLLAVGPTEGNAAEILSECNKSPMLEYEDVAGIKDYINGLFHKYLADINQWQVGNENYSNYSRKGTTEKLAAILSNT